MTKAENEPNTPSAPIVWIAAPTGYDEYGIRGVHESIEDARWHWPSDTWRLEDDGHWYSGKMDSAGIYLYAETVKTAGGVQDRYAG